MHGRNLFPDEHSRVQGSGHRLHGGDDPRRPCAHGGTGPSAWVSKPSYFADRYTRDPLFLFRIFHYPPASSDAAAHSEWGVGEHTDYGMLTSPAAGRDWWVAGEGEGALDGCPAIDRVPGLQCRGHARSIDRWPLSLHPPPCAQTRRSWSPVLPVLLRPELQRPDRADRSPRHVVVDDAGSALG